MATESSKTRSEFQPGHILGERFRILHPIGAGGMGMVYAALDLKVDRKVALKCAHAGHHFRLNRETRAAAEVSHFNVCKTHDVHTVSTPQGDRDCISMELIEGETLSARIRRAGPFEPKDAAAIAEQICAGLAQCHSERVIHGDLKCGNIMLEAQPSGATRAVITDFGLAHLEGGAASSGGTPDYMAPEQFLGESASQSTDIYALGVIFHVMLTGRVPVYEVAPTLLRKGSPTELPTVSMGQTWERLDSSDRKWSRKVDRLPGQWGSTVTRCLAIKPSARFPNAAAVAKSLQPRQWIWRTALAAGLAVALIAGEREWQARVRETPVRLDILPFAGDATSRVQGVGAEVAQRLNGARRRFSVVQSAQETGATHIVEVRLNSTGESKFHAGVRLVDVKSGAAIRELNADYDAQEGDVLAKAIVATISETFHLPAAAAETVSPAAYASYAQGLEALRQRDVTRAIELFQKATREDGKSALTHAGLAEAYLQRGVAGTADLEAAESALAEATRINPDAVPVLLASGLADQRRGKYEVAIREFSRATEIAPENGDAWERLADVYAATGQKGESITIHKKAIELEPNDYRRYQALAREYLARGEYQESVIPFRKAAELAPGLSEVHEDLGGVLLQLGQTEEAERELLSALKQRPTRNLMINLGALYYSTRRFKEAAEQFERSLTLGNPLMLQYRNLGDAYRQLGRKNDAARCYREAERLVEAEVVRNPRAAPSHSRLGLVRAFLGNREGANLELSQAISLQSTSRVVMRDSAIAYEFMGDRDKALSLLTSAPGEFLQELARHPDLKSLTGDQRFLAILARQSSKSQ